MRISKILYQLSLIVGLFILISGIIMKFFNVNSSGWFFTKRGNLINGTLDANGTIIVSFILLCFSIWFKKTYKKEKRDYERRKGIEKNEDILRKTNNIFKIRKMNKKQGSC